MRVAARMPPACGGFTLLFSVRQCQEAQLARQRPRVDSTASNRLRFVHRFAREGCPERRASRHRPGTTEWSDEALKTSTLWLFLQAVELLAEAPAARLHAFKLSDSVILGRRPRCCGAPRPRRHGERRRAAVGDAHEADDRGGSLEHHTMRS